MNLSTTTNFSRFCLFAVAACALLFSTTTQFAQNQTQLPARSGHVNDFAGVIDKTTQEKLSTLLENMQQKIGIDFAVVTINSTAGQDIFDFSRQVAANWNVGARTTANKSLLLVVAVDQKQSFTQFSKSVQGDLPDAVLGEMSQRMKALINAGNFSGGLNAGVHLFVESIAEKRGLNVADFEAPVNTQAADSTGPKPEGPSTTAESSARAVRPRIATVLNSTETHSKKAAEETAPAPEKPVTVKASTKVRTSPSTEITATNDKTGNTSTERPAPRVEPSSTPKKPATTAEDDADESEEVELTLTLPLDKRITRLKEFLQDYPDSKSKSRAIELLVSAYASLGDQRLKKGDVAGGLEQLRLAIDTAPADMSEKLFSGVVAQIPLNLYLRGERAAAAQVAQNIETKFGTDAKRLVVLSGYYISTEQAGEAVRIATQAATLAPDLSETHQALGLALHISLRLDEALAEYKRALELDPNSKAARRGVADLSRASGKSEEALSLYRQQLATDAADKAARAGLVIALLDLGRTQEAKTELEAALKADPKNLSLLSGAAYWFAAHNDVAQASEFARKALEIEPRYTWSHVAMARSFVAEKKPLNAERALRFARQYGRFPTLDYELANALCAAGLYAEAAEVLLESFDWNGAQIETRLAGRTPARASNFLELLAPERRASIFQSTAADTEANATMLKNLLVLSVASNQEQKGGSLNERTIVAAAKQFASGNDAALVHRQLYAASRLLQKGIGYEAAHELAEAARSSADAGLNVPEVTLAVQADEYRDIRARAIAAGGTPDIVEAPRNILSNLMRGRIEDISGWSLFNLDRVEEAVEHLNRAANILPARTPVWRTSLWHLGAALDRLDRREEALSNYIKSYSVGDQDPARRTIIERLYRKIHGSLEGLDDQIGAASSSISSQPAPASGTKDNPQIETPSPADAGANVTPTSSATTGSGSSVPIATLETNPSPAVSKPATTRAAQAAATKLSPAESEVVERMNTPNPTVVVIKGRVTDSTNKPIANVVVVLISPQGSVLASTSDERGNYSFSVAPSSHNYRVIPSKDGFVFEPVDRLLSGITQDQSELNFVGVSKVAP